MRVIFMLSCVAVTLSGCSRIAQSPLNPVNWFERAEQVVTPEERRPIVPDNSGVQIVDQRQPVGEIIGISLDRTPDGAIVSARSRVASQGLFNAQLVLRSVENGVATYDFVAQASTGGAGSQDITAAAVLSNQDLVGIRRIVVRGAGNSRAINR